MPDLLTRASPPGPITERSPAGAGSPGVSQRRQVLWIVALASLPLIVLVLAGIWQGKVRAERQVAEERIGLARAGALTTFAFVDGNLSTARSLAHTAMLMSPGASSGIDRFLGQVLAENPDWDGWGLAGVDGWNVASTGAAPHTLYVGDREYYQQAVQTGRAVVSPAILNRRLNTPTVVLAAPVDFESGGRGAIIVSLSTARLAGELAALRQDTGIRIALVDADGSLFVHPDMNLAAQLPSLRGDPSVEAALAGQAGSTISTRADGRQIIVAHAPVTDLGWGVLVSQPTDEAFEVIERQTLLGIVVLALAAIMAGGIGWYLGGRLGEIYRQQQEATAHAEATAERLAVVSAESERRRRFFEGVIESAPIAIAIMRGPELRYEAVNPRFQALRPGIPMLGERVGDIFAAASEVGFLEVLRRVYQTGEQFVGVDRAWHTPVEDRTPPIRYFTYVISRLDGEDGRPGTILSMVLETTEAVLTRQKAEREKDEFLSIASHELKTPLTALGLAAQLVDRVIAQEPLDEARLSRHVRTIQTQVTRMSTLINDLLFMSRIDAGRLTVTAGRVNLVALARDAADRQRDTLPDESGERIVVQAEQPSIEVRGDPTRIGQVFTNLLSNAIKYSPDGGPIELILTASPEQATIRVVDRGIGIPEAERDDIFSPFRRASTAVNAAIEGTGLGLYITRRIVEAHGGTIRLEGTPGGGTTFEVTLPTGRNVASTAAQGDAEHGPKAT